MSFLPLLLPAPSGGHSTTSLGCRGLYLPFQAHPLLQGRDLPEDGMVLLCLLSCCHDLCAGGEGTAKIYSSSEINP